MINKTYYTCAEQAYNQQTFVSLDDVLKHFKDMYWRRIQQVFNVTTFRLPRRLEDVLYRRLEDILQDVLEDEILLR